MPVGYRITSQASFAYVPLPVLPHNFAVSLGSLKDRSFRGWPVSAWQLGSSGQFPYTRSSVCSPLMGFLPLQRFKYRKFTHAGFTSPDYVPLLGFFSLLGVSSSRNRPALFHAGNAPGVLPPGLFPLGGCASLSGFATLLPLESGPAPACDKIR